MITDNFQELSAEDQTVFVAGMVARAFKYINDRRPYETRTLAILREKGYDLLDAYEGPKRAKQVN